MSGLRPTLAELGKIDIGLDWNILGLKLKVSPEKIEEISRRPDSYETKTLLMFAEWLRISPEASWEHLREAMNSLRLRCISNSTAPEKSGTASSNFCLAGESRANKELHVNIPEPPHAFHKGVKKLKCTYGLLFDRIESELISTASTNNIDIVPMVKKYLNRCFPELQMDRAKGIEDILQIVESECDVTDIICLTGIVKFLESKSIYIDISDCESNLDSQVESFCQILRNSLSDDLSLYKRLVFKSTSVDNAKHILALLRKTFAHQRLLVDLEVLEKIIIPAGKGLRILIIICAWYIWKTSKTKRVMPTCDAETKESTMTHFDTHAREPWQHLTKKEASNFSCNETVSSNLGPEIELLHMRDPLLMSSFPTDTYCSMSYINCYERQPHTLFPTHTQCSMSDMNCLTDYLGRQPYMTNAPIEASFLQCSVLDDDFLLKIDNFSAIQPHQTNVPCNLSMDVNGLGTSINSSDMNGLSTSMNCSNVNGVINSTVNGVITPTVTDVITFTVTGVITPTVTDVITPTVTDVITSTVTDVITSTHENKNYSLGNIVGGGGVILGYFTYWILFIVLILIICSTIYMSFRILFSKKVHCRHYDDYENYEV